MLQNSSQDRDSQWRSDGLAFGSQSPLGNLVSRIHKLPSAAGDIHRIFIKRDDELGPLCLGSKWRKLAALVSYIKANHVTAVLASGHSRSAFLMGLRLLSREYGFTLHSHISHERDSRQHPGSDTYAWALGLREETEPVPPHAVSLDEGGFHEACLIGGVSLACEIASEEMRFSAIYLDAGSGMIALAASWALTQLLPAVDVRIIDIGGIQHDLARRVQNIEDWAYKTWGQRSSCAFECLAPTVWPGFGKVTRSSMLAIRAVFENFGILLDPIYGLKAWLTMQDDLARRPAGLPVLFVHSGGQLVLPGYHQLIY